MNKETTKPSTNGKQSRIVDIFIVIFSILAFCILLALIVLVARNVIVKSAKTPIPTDTIRDLDSYNSAISNISSSVAVTYAWIVSDSPSTKSLHISIKNNSPWSIQIAKIVIGDNSNFFTRNNQKLENPFYYNSAGFCQSGPRPDLPFLDNFPQVPGYDLSDYHFEIPGQATSSTAEYECGFYPAAQITASSKICVVFYPISKYSFETFNYVYRDNYYTVSPEWEKAFDEFRLVTVCNR
jgi:hypothetical protein